MEPLHELCTYALHCHMQAAHPIVAPPYFIVGEEERAAVVKCFVLRATCSQQGNPLAHSCRPNPYGCSSDYGRQQFQLRF